MDLARPILYSAIYLSIIGLAYVLDLPTVVNLLTIPWSIPVMMLSGLITHMTVKGRELMDIASLVGGVINVLLYLSLNQTFRVQKGRDK